MDPDPEDYEAYLAYMEEKCMDEECTARALPNPNPKSVLDYFYFVDHASSSKTKSEKSEKNKSKSKKGRGPIPSAVIRQPHGATVVHKGRDLPKEYTKLLYREGYEDVKLIIIKKIFKTDLDEKENRLTMPSNQLITKEFLRPDEDEKLSKVGGKLEVKVIDFSMKLHDMCLKFWSSVGWYAIIRDWNTIVRSNPHLAVGDLIQIWAYRVRGNLGFLMHKVDTSC